MSRNSPTPQSFPLRSEKRGTATPAPCQRRRPSRSRSPQTTAASPPEAGKRRFPPSSQQRRAPDFRSRITNLYSAPAVRAGSETRQTGAAASFIMTLCATSQRPSSSAFPATASTSSRRSVGASTSKRIFAHATDRGSASSSRRKTASVNIDVRKGESSDGSYHAS